jgi:large subunit ribosomal protein L21
MNGLMRNACRRALRSRINARSTSERIDITNRSNDSNSSFAGKSIFDRSGVVVATAGSSSSSSSFATMRTGDDGRQTFAATRSKRGGGDFSRASRRTTAMMMNVLVRPYSKSLGTDGGLKPDQVLVPESYVVLDPSKFSVKHGEGDEKVKISEKNVFAVVSVGSHQHKVSPDDLFFVEKLHGANVNDVVQLPRVLMLGSKTKTIIGRPVVENARVTCLVEEVVRDEKTIIFKKRRRKYSRRWNGARQTMTGLRVLDVEGIDE